MNHVLDFGVDLQILEPKSIETKRWFYFGSSFEIGINSVIYVYL